MTYIRILCAIAITGLIAGCSSEPEAIEPPPQARTGPKPLATDKILSDFYKRSGVNLPLPENDNALMTKSAADRLVASMAELQRMVKRAEDPDAVVNTVAEQLSAKIKEAEERKLYSFVEPHVRAYQILRPDDKLFSAYLERAKEQLTRPRVALRGLYHDHNSGTITASVKVFDPLTRETTTQNIRMGEELAGLKFTRIIGKDEGIELELTRNGMVFQIMKGEDLK